MEREAALLRARGSRRIKRRRISELAQLERPIAHFRGFWALIENGPVTLENEVSELDQIMSRFADFWAQVVQSEEVIGDQGLNDVDPGPESDDDGPEENYASMDHFAQMFILESEQRYLRRTVQINNINMQNQKKRLKGVLETVKIMKLELRSLVRARKKREAERRKERHKIEGSFVQFWKGVEGQEMAEGEDPDYAEYFGDFFALTKL